MKILFLFALTFSLQAYSQCHCRARQGASSLVDVKNSTLEECQDLIGESLSQRFESKQECQSSTSVDIQWGCQAALAPKSFSCEELHLKQNAEASLQAAVTAGELLNIDWSLKPDVCDKTGEAGHDHSSHAKVLPPGMMMMELSPQDLAQTLKDFNLLKDQTLEQVLAKINEDSVTFEIPRKLPAPATENGGSIKIKFKKERNGSTTMTVDENPSGNKLSSPTGSNFKLAHVDAFLLEERVDKLTIKSAAAGKAFFWKVEGGIHRVYGENHDQGRLLSRSEDQLQFHRRVPENLPDFYHGRNKNRPKGYFIGGQAHLTVDRALSSAVTVSAYGGVEARATSLNGSYVGAITGAKVTKDLSNGSHLTVGADASVRTNGQSLTVFVEAGNDSRACRLSHSRGEITPIPNSYFENRHRSVTRVGCKIKW